MEILYGFTYNDQFLSIPPGRQAANNVILMLTQILVIEFVEKPRG